jgi:CRP/FNR family cyclic AMP-dependent transcriptional regulator
MQARHALPVQSEGRNVAMDKYFDIVSNSPLGVELNEDHSAILSKLVDIRSLKDGEILIREGAADSVLFVVVSGSVAVTRGTGAADWIVLHVLKPRDLAGELGFLDGMEHSATLRAIGPAEVYTLRRERLEELLETHPRIVYLVMRAVVREVHAILRRMNVQYVELTNYITKQHGRY